MTFAEQLRAARAATGLSQSQAALAMGRSVRTLQAWEQGRNVPHPTIQAAAFAALPLDLRKPPHPMLATQHTPKRWLAAMWRASGMSASKAQAEGLRECAEASYLATYWSRFTSEVMQGHRAKRAVILKLSDEQQQQYCHMTRGD